MVRTLQIPYDDSVFLEISLPQAGFEREAKLLLAAKSFELGRLSSGKAAELRGMGRLAFLASLKRVGVSMSNLRPEDVVDEVDFAKRREVSSRQEKPGKGESHVGDERKPIEGNPTGQSPSGKG